MWRGAERCGGAEVVPQQGSTCGDEGGDCAMKERSEEVDGLAEAEATSLTLKRPKGQ